MAGLAGGVAEVYAWETLSSSEWSFSRPQEADAMTEMLMAERPLREMRRGTAKGLRPVPTSLTIDHVAS